jgi:hypothetical protein
MGFVADLNQEVVIYSIIGLFIVVFIWLILNRIQLSKARKQYSQMMNGGRPENVEQLLIGLQNSINALTLQNNMQQSEIEQMKKQMRKMKSNVSIQRYNAFSEIGGSDLSFSIAILDEEQDGVVLTGIHGREQTFIYAKPVEKGQSTYNLTPEEKTIIDRIALKSNA